MVGFEPTFSPGEGWSFIQLNYMATILKNFYSRKGPVYVRQRAPHFVFPNLQQLLPHNCIYPLTRAVSLTGTRPTAVTYLLHDGRIGFNFVSLADQTAGLIFLSSINPSELLPRSLLTCLSPSIWLPPHHTVERTFKGAVRVETPRPLDCLHFEKL
jgi:hypothetical protein